MSTLDASIFMAGNTANFAKLKDLILSLATREKSSSASSVSTNTNPFSDANSTTFDVAADEEVEWKTNFMCSIDDLTCVGGYRLVVNGVVIGDGYNVRPKEEITNNGLVRPVSLGVRVKDLAAGPATFKLQIQRSTGSGNFCLAHSYMWFGITKRRT